MKRFRNIRTSPGWYGTGIVPDAAKRRKDERSGGGASNTWTAAAMAKPGPGAACGIEPSLSAHADMAICLFLSFGYKIGQPQDR